MVQAEVNGPSRWLHVVLITPLYVRVTQRYCKGRISFRDRIMGPKLLERAEVEPMVECFWLQTLVGKWTLRCLWSCDWRVCGKTCFRGSAGENAALTLDVVGPAEC